MSFLYIFGYTLKTKYKNLENFINLFPSLLVIKVQIFNHPFCIFGYTLKTKYENLEFLKRNSHHFLCLSSNLESSFSIFGYTLKTKYKNLAKKFPVSWVIRDLQSYLIFEFWIFLWGEISPIKKVSSTPVFLFSFLWCSWSRKQASDISIKFDYN